MAITLEKLIAHNFTINYFINSFWRALKKILSSLAARVWEIEIPPPHKKHFKIPENIFFRQNWLKFCRNAEETVLYIYEIFGYDGSVKEPTHWAQLAHSNPQPSAAHKTSFTQFHTGLQPVSNWLRKFSVSAHKCL